MVCQSCMSWRVADMNRPLSTIEVNPVEVQVSDDPIDHLTHVFVLDDEIAGSAAAFANKSAVVPTLTCCVLIKLRRDAPLDIACQIG